MLLISMCTQHHLTSRSFGHRVPDQCDHPQSSAAGLLLLPRSSSLPAMLHLPPAHHETSKRDFTHDTKIKVKLAKCPEFEFKPCQVNDSSHSNQGTNHLVSQASTARRSSRMSTSLVIPLLVFVPIKASMLGGTNPISRLTTANKVVWVRTSTKVNLISRILFGIN
jgi:hypothetical protein